MNGLFAIRASDCRTSSSTSANASAAQGGCTPVSARIDSLKSSSVKVSMPQQGNP